MEKQISIIIPVYNGEQFIDKCLSSVVAQVAIDLEVIDVIVINDGSTDGSLGIMREYEANYPGIVRVIDQANQGAANTRNNGVKLAAGKHLMFVDQDDFINEDCCHVFYHEIEERQLDVVQGGYALVAQDGSLIRRILPVNSTFGHFLAIPAWAKIHRTSFLRSKNISFFVNNIGEDNVFTTHEVLSTDKYGCIDYVGYNHLEDNQASVTNSLHKGLSREVNITNLLHRLISLTPETPTMRHMLEYLTIRTAVYYLLLYGKFASPARFEAAYATIFQWLVRDLPFFSHNRYIWRKPAGEKVAAQLGIIIMIMVHKLRLVRVFARLYCKG